MNDGLKLSTKLIVMLSTLSMIILLSGPLGYKSEVLPLQPALVLLIVALGTAGLAFIGSLIMLVLAIKADLIRNRNFLLMALALSLVPTSLVGLQLKKAITLPEIHDISTDISTPPLFNKIVQLRKGAPNDLVYEYKGSSKKLAELQLAAYPELKTIHSHLTVTAAIERVVTVLNELGLDIVHVDQNEGLVEATATTYWYAFKDDVVVRIKARDQGSLIDLRSVSRVGRSDVGANAARIMAFSSRF